MNALICLARIWSIEMPASSQVSLVGGEMSVRNRVLALACAPPGRPGVGTQARLLSTSRSSLNGASGASVGVSSKPTPSRRRRPLLHDHAVRDVHHAESRDRRRRGLLERCQGRHHRVEQRQGECGTDASQNRAAWDRLPGDQHGCSFHRRAVARRVAGAVACRSALRSAVLIVNGVLVATPRMTDDQRYPLRRRVARDAAHRGQIARIQTPPERVGEQLLRERAREVLLMTGDELPQAGDALERACRRGARPTHPWDAVARRPPLAECIEVLEREAERIHPHVADGARRVLPVRFHLLPDRHRLGVGAALIQQRDVGWRRRRRCAEDVVEQPAAAQHRRRAVRIRRDGQDAALTEQPAPHAVGEGDAPEVAAVHVRDPVVAGEPLVHERVVRGDQIDDAAILAQLAIR